MSEKEKLEERCTKYFNAWARLDKENEELKQLIKDLNGRAKGIKRILKKCMLPGSFCIKNWEEFYFNIEPDIRYAFLEAYNSVEQIKNYEQKSLLTTTVKCSKIKQKEKIC